MDWKPIETAQLDDKTPVLLYCPGINSWNRLDNIGDMVVGIWQWHYGRKSGCWYGDIGDVDQGYESTGAYFEREQLHPTHWMPLPEKPKE